MIAVDFIYDGQHLSSKGYAIVQFDNSGGLATSVSGSEIEFVTVPRHHGQYHSKNHASFQDCLRTTLQICKNPDEYLSQDAMEITSDEFRALMHWLNQRDFKQMCFLDEDGAAECYYDASFNLSKLRIGGKTYGVELTMVTNRPFGYGEAVRKVTTAAKLVLDTSSDDVGYLYPTFEITPANNASVISIKNLDTNREMTIKNCIKNEVITVNSDTMTITTSSTTHDIANDFNYEFLKLANSLTSKSNTLQISPAGTKVSVSYRPIIKEIP